MPWSTSQLAGLAGTTVKAVRHYHRLGLLDEPERLSNGYKQYEVRHVLRLLRIVRLAELGVPLARIPAFDGVGEPSDATLRELDGEVEKSIERLRRVREELAVILSHRSPAELPSGFGPVAHKLTERERSLMMIYARVFDGEAMDALRRMTDDGARSDPEREFEALPPDADRGSRRRLAADMAAVMTRANDAYPWLRDPGVHAQRDAAHAQAVIGEALRELYNRAQVEVLYRAHLIATGQTEQLDALDAALEVRAAADDG